MDSQLPIRPEAASFVFSATPAAGPATLSTMPAGNADVVYLMDGAKLPSGSRAWIGWGMTSDAAKANAVVPLIGSPSAAFALAAGTVQGFTLTGGIFLSAIMESGSGTIACTVGFGV